MRLRPDLAGAAVLAVLVMGCGSEPAAAVTPAPTASGPTVSLPTTASAVRPPSPHPSGKPLVSCSFPVLAVDSSGDLSGYFLSVPSGTKTTSTLRLRQSGVLWQTVDKPYLMGRPGFTNGFYDRAVNRWLPADAAAVSPDGLHYAYASGGFAAPNELHIVDVLTGADHLVATGHDYFPLDYRKDGLYLTQRNAGSALYSGSSLFVLNPTTWVVRQLHSSTRLERWTVTFGDYAYGSDFSPADRTSFGSGESTNELIRISLKTGAVVRFQYHPGKPIYVVGMSPAGELLAEVDGLGIIDAAGAVHRIPGAPVNAVPYADSRRAWLYSGDSETAASGTRSTSLYLLSGGAAEHVMDFRWGNNDRFAGTCR